MVEKGKIRKLDVEVHRGKIIAVWYGCIALPFDVYEVDETRARDLSGDDGTPHDNGYEAIELFDHRITEALSPPVAVDIPIGRETGE